LKTVQSPREKAVAPRLVASTYLQRINSQDASGVAALFGRDAVFRGPNGEVLHGSEAIRAFYVALFARSRPALRLGRVLIDGRKIAFEVMGSRSPGGGEVGALAFDLLETDTDGLITDFTVFLRSPA
jgi:hypothetical protein